MPPLRYAFVGAGFIPPSCSALRTYQGSRRGDHWSPDDKQAQRATGGRGMPRPYKGVYRRGGIHPTLVFRADECNKEVVGATIGRPMPNKRSEQLEGGINAAPTERTRPHVTRQHHFHPPKSPRPHGGPGAKPLVVLRGRGSPEVGRGKSKSPFPSLARAERKRNPQAARAHATS